MRDGLHADSFHFAALPVTSSFVRRMLRLARHQTVKEACLIWALCPFMPRSEDVRSRAESGMDRVSGLGVRRSYNGVSRRKHAVHS